MKVEEAFHDAVKILSLSGSDSPHIDARIILSNLLNCSSHQIILKYSQLDLSETQYQKYLNLIKLRASKVPITHITNNREFYGNNFFVNSDVLDPRPDSEAMIEMIFEKYPDLSSKKSLCEIGSGSGCLIISLLKIYKNWNGIALDISPSAIEIAKINAVKNAISSQICFMQSDIFSALNKNHLFDIIISNPPYIPTNDIENLQDEVKKYEPRIALDGGFDGLEFYRKIATGSSPFLKDRAQIFVEIGFNQHDDVIKIFQNQGFKFLNFKKDLNNIIRILEFIK